MDTRDSIKQNAAPRYLRFPQLCLNERNVQSTLDSCLLSRLNHRTEQQRIPGVDVHGPCLSTLVPRADFLAELEGVARCLLQGE